MKELLKIKLVKWLWNLWENKSVVGSVDKLSSNAITAI